MAGGNRVTLTFAGDGRDLSRAFDKLGRDADKFDRKISNLGKSAQGMGAGFERSSRALSTAAKGLAGVAATGFASEFLLVAGKMLASGMAKLLHGLGALAAIGPAAGLAAVAAFGTMKLALSGVADVLSAGLTGDAEKFEELLKDLSPSARGFAREVVALKGRLDGLRRTAQENFFAPMVASVRPLAERYLPSVQRTVGEIGRAFGNAGRETADFLLLPRVGVELDRALQNVGQAVSNVAGGLPDLVRAFVPLVTVGSEFLPQLTRGFAGLTDRFADWMEKIARSGQLRDFIQGGLDDLEDLGAGLMQAGRIAGNFIGGLGDLFSDANLPTGRFADSLEAISEQFEAWASTAAAQERVRDIVEFLRNVDWGKIAEGAAALGAMSTAFKGAAGIAGLVQGIMALTALGAPGLVILGVAAAVALLAGGFVLAFRESEAFRSFVNDQLVPALKEMWHWAEETLLPAFRRLGEYASGELSDSWGAFTAAVQRNWPELEKVGNLIREIAEVVGPLLVLALGAMVVGWQVLLFFMSMAIDVLGALVRAFEGVKGAVQGAVNWIVDHIEALINYLRGLPGRFAEALSGLWDGLMPPSFGDIAGRLPGVGGGRIVFPTSPVKGFHQGGVVPGAPGTEMLARLQAGERVTRAGQSAGTVVHLYVAGSVLTDRDLIRLVRDEFQRGGFSGL